MKIKSNADLKRLRSIVENYPPIEESNNEYTTSNNWIRLLCEIQNSKIENRIKQYSQLVMNILKTLIGHKAYYAFTMSVWNSNVVLEPNSEDEFFWSMYRICSSIPCKILGEETLKTNIPYIEMIRMIQMIINHVGEEEFWEQFMNDWENDKIGERVNENKL